jgi:hypothetical protein
MARHEPNSLELQLITSVLEGMIAEDDPFVRSRGKNALAANPWHQWLLATLRFVL